MRQPSRFSEVGFESMKMGVFLLFGRTKRPDLHRNSPPAFFAAFRWQLGARCSLDRCDNSRAAGVRLDRSFQANPLLVAHFVAPEYPDLPGRASLNADFDQKKLGLKSPLIRGPALPDNIVAFACHAHQIGDSHASAFFVLVRGRCPSNTTRALDFAGSEDR